MINLDNLIKELNNAFEDDESVNYKITVKRAKKGKAPHVSLRVSNENKSMDYNAGDFASVNLLVNDVRQVVSDWSVPSYSR